MDNSKTAITAMMALSVLVLFTATAVSATFEPEISISTGEFSGMQFLDSGGGASEYNVIWDNGMNFDGMISSQNDLMGFDCLPADDFSFTEKQIVRDVHWIGGYWNFYSEPHDANFVWEITFYNDNGTGNQPGAVIAAFYFLNAETHVTKIFNTSTSIYYNYSVDLPTPIEFEANTKYWVSIQGIGYFPPQSGWAYHYSPLLLHEAVAKSAYFGYPDWTNVSEFSPPLTRDMCFQLTGSKAEAEAPALTPIGLIVLVTMLSAIAAVSIQLERRKRL
jgi:hypothetical protein